MEEFLSKIWNFASRNAVLYVILGLVYYLVLPGTAEMKTVMFIISIEVLAILLSGLAVFAYTNIDFFKLLNEGSDGEMNSVERHAVLDVIAKIFLGVHLLVGLTVIGIYAVVPN